jgi:hypothetical protein
MKPFFCQELADGGNDGYFPEFLYPDEPDGWKWANIDGHWFTYIIFSDRSRTPLYIGQTNNIYRRLSQHKRKVWWPLVDKIIVDSCDSAEQAKTDESHWIAHYQPMFNIVRPKGSSA